MTILLIGLLIFFGIHSISVMALPLRDRLAATSPLGWKGFYSIASLLGLVLIIMGYGELKTEPTILYTTPFWMRYVSAVLLLPFFVFFLASLLPGRIQSKLKNPLLIATKTWALAHLLVNGALADVLVFGSFLVWAVAVRVSLKHRTPRHYPRAPQSPVNDAIVIVAGLALYAVTFLWLHEWLFGVPVIA